MMRQRTRKSVDEIYGTKAETNLVKPKPIAAVPQKLRAQRENSNITPANMSNNNNNNNNNATKTQVATTVGSVNNATFRRKSARERLAETKVLNEKSAEKEKEEKEKEKEKVTSSSEKHKREGRRSRKSPNAGRADRAQRIKPIDSNQFILTLEDIVKDQHIPPTQQTQKHHYVPAHKHYSAQHQNKYQHKTVSYQQQQHHRQNQAMPDNKEALNYQKSRQRQEQVVPVANDDKDDDSEEFFELIKETVESAIGKTISDLLNRNFRDVNAKIDQFAQELNDMKTMMRNLQTDINNKIVHYGEENSRHYRYLCMKSEYDKMFYQHNVMLNGNPTMLVPQMPSPHTTPPQMPTPQISAQQVPMPQMAAPPQMPTPNIATQHLQQSALIPMQSLEGAWPAPAMYPTNISSGELVLKSSPYIYQGANSAAHHMPQNGTTITTTTTETHNCLSKQSSEAQMRDVIDHIQRFCISMQSNESYKSNSQPSQDNNYPQENAMIINKDVFLDNDVDDDDECMLSSDGMTPRSVTQIDRYEIKSMQYYNTQGAMGDA